MSKTDPLATQRRHIFALASDLEEPLEQALAFAHTLNLMGCGLHNMDDDLASAFVAVAEALTGELSAAKKTWRQIMKESRTPKPHRVG